MWDVPCPLEIQGCWLVGISHIKHIYYTFYVVMSAEEREILNTWESGPEKYWVLLLLFIYWMDARCSIIAKIIDLLHLLLLNLHNYSVYEASIGTHILLMRKREFKQGQTRSLIHTHTQHVCTTHVLDTEALGRDDICRYGVAGTVRF